MSIRSYQFWNYCRNQKVYRDLKSEVDSKQNKRNSKLFLSLYLVSSVKVSGVDLFFYVIQTAVIAVGDNGLGHLFEF